MQQKQHKSLKMYIKSPNPKTNKQDNGPFNSLHVKYSYKKGSKKGWLHVLGFPLIVLGYACCPGIVNKSVHFYSQSVPVEG